MLYIAIVSINCLMKLGTLLEFRGSHSYEYVDEESGLLRCDTVSLGEWS